MYFVNQKVFRFQGDFSLLSCDLPDLRASRQLNGSFGGCTATSGILHYIQAFEKMVRDSAFLLKRLFQGDLFVLIDAVSEIHAFALF